MDRGAWQATVHGVSKSQTWLSDCHFLSLFRTWEVRMRCFELEQPFYRQGKKDQVNHSDLTSLNFLKNAEATYFPNSLVNNEMNLWEQPRLYSLYLTAKYLLPDKYLTVNLPWCANPRPHSWASELYLIIKISIH